MEIVYKNQSIECLTPSSQYSSYIDNIEEYARICFQSDGHIGESFVKRILVNQHESVLEHFNLSFKIITDRAIANALVRHRHCAFTQESTHYIPYGKKETIEIVRPIGLFDRDILEVDKGMYAIMMRDNTANYKLVYDEYGKDIARSLLPLGLKTELRMTTNLREWRHIIRLRGAFDHPQMLELIRLLCKWFQENLPLFVEDINVK